MDELMKTVAPLRLIKFQKNCSILKESDNNVIFRVLIIIKSLNILKNYVNFPKLIRIFVLPN